ncbi:MAG: hypothetical protein QXL43_02305, partial [Methanolinea sp.]
MTKTPEDALRVIQSHPEGVLQSDLWKILDVDSRKCSRLVKKLLDEGILPDPDEWYLVLGEEDLVNMGLGDLPPEEEEYFKQIGNIVHHSALHAEMHPQRGTWQYRVER